MNLIDDLNKAYSRVKTFEITRFLNEIKQV